MAVPPPPPCALAPLRSPSYGSALPPLPRPMQETPHGYAPLNALVPCRSPTMAVPVGTPRQLDPIFCWNSV